MSPLRKAPDDIPYRTYYTESRDVDECTRDADGALMQEPRCPELGCGCGVDRPKCFFELGGYCPRHPLADEWRRSRWGKMRDRWSRTQRLLWQWPEDDALWRIYAHGQVYQGA
jgi:hypothetical protein